MDNPGTEVQNLILPRDLRTEFEFEPETLGGIGIIRFDALEMHDNDSLYSVLGERKGELSPIRAAAIPYYAWANRGPGTMRVWIPRC